MILAPRPAVAFALMLGLAACGGTPAVNEPTDFEDLPTATSATATPGAVNPTASAPGATATPNVAGWGRPAEIALVLSGTIFDADGTYTASGPSRQCGNIMINVTGNTRAFGFEYGVSPEGRGVIGEVMFGADDLLPGTTTTSFSVSADVIAEVGGAGPAIVIQPNRPGSGDSGTASRSEADGTTTLIVQATNAFGESVDLTVVCGPG